MYSLVTNTASVFIFVQHDIYNSGQVGMQLLIITGFPDFVHRPEF
jgi:hypothetical protein